MFTREQKHAIAEAIQQLLRDTHHPGLPSTEIQFHLRVRGVRSWQYANIVNNGDVPEALTGEGPAEGPATEPGWHL